MDEGELVFDKDDGNLKIQGEFVNTEGTWALESVDGNETTNVNDKPFTIFKISESKIIHAKISAQLTNRKKMFSEKQET